ncbi:MAG: homoserine dehydrogenase [Proteobacteria bacterium]|nr:homoserine dehydrogenase [Pseudomonadota bacterium]
MPATASASAVEPSPPVAPIRIALLGVGTVGRALLQRLDALAGSALTQRLRLVHIANSTQRFVPSPIAAWQSLPLVEGPGAATTALGTHGTRILIDATASQAVAEQHARWLAQGIHVVTACKLGQGTALARWRAIRAGCAHGGTHYGDSATVGAGLPLLRSIRELQAGGDRIHGIAGVLSGSLAWLFNHYDGMRPFSALVRQARAAGYTEPDPREDLSGEDVRRKLLILARAAGFALDADAVEVDSLVPATLAALSKDDVDAALPLLDAPLRERYAEAYKRGEKLRFVARLERGDNGRVQARVGLESLPADAPLAGGTGTDNRVAITCDRYRPQPLLIQGPGAGAQVTAAALLDDVLRIASITSV